MLRLLPLVLTLLAVGGGFVFAAGRLKRHFIRYEISGDSMLPALAHGDCVIVDSHANSSRETRAGDIVLARDPREPTRTLVKRVSHLEPGGAWLLGDNPGSSTDSRTFGPVARKDILGRVRWRYWPVASGPRISSPE